MASVSAPPLQSRRAVPALLGGMGSQVTGLPPPPVLLLSPPWSLPEALHRAPRSRSPGGSQWSYLRSSSCRGEREPVTVSTRLLPGGHLLDVPETACSQEQSSLIRASQQPGLYPLGDAGSTTPALASH